MSIGLLGLPLKPPSNLYNNHLLNATNCALVNLSKLLLNARVAIAQKVEPEWDSRSGPWPIPPS